MTVDADARVVRVACASIAASERARHEAHMRRAIEQARRNPRRPFGAVIVDGKDERVLAEAVNAVDVSPILHGETAAIDACARANPGCPWPRLRLYTTAEPCAMCAAAITWTGLGTVIIATGIDTLTRFGVRQIDLACHDVLRAAPSYRGRVITGVLSAETDRMYADWARSLSG